MRGLLVLGSVLALGATFAGCGGGGGGSNEEDDPTESSTPGNPTATATRTSESNATPVSSGATAPPTATTTAETTIATPTTAATAQATNTTAAATPTKPAAAVTPAPAPTQAPQPTATPTEPPSSGNPLTANVGVSGTSRYFWAPQSVKIAPGGEVTFAWSGGAAHDLSVPQLGFNTAAKTSASHTVTFPAAGTYSVVCVIHEDTMRGTVIVQ